MNISNEISITCADEIYSLVADCSCILQDLERWKKHHQKSLVDNQNAFNYFWSKRQEFRSVIRYRVTQFKEPVIGSNVSVYAHAVVIGGITIGDNVKIGAGAVVLENIPPNATVVPQRSRIILKASK